MWASFDHPAATFFNSLPDGSLIGVAIHYWALADFDSPYILAAVFALILSGTVPILIHNEIINKYSNRSFVKQVGFF